MVDVQEGFEAQDLAGSSAHYNSNASTTAAFVPSSANKVISEFCIQNVSSNKNDVLYVSLDGGTNFRQVQWNSTWAWSPKGGLTQLKVKSNAASVAYEIVINYEDF